MVGGVLFLILEYVFLAFLLKSCELLVGVEDECQNTIFSPNENIFCYYFKCSLISYAYFIGCLFYIVYWSWN